MTLSESKFRAIMSGLRSDAQKINEKRRSPRVGVGVRGVVLIHSTRKMLSVYVRDLSISGVGVTCEQPIAAGEHISLLLLKADGKSTHILYTVRHCHKAINGIYDVGAQVVETPANAAVAIPAEAPTLPERPPATPQEAAAPA